MGKPVNLWRIYSLERDWVNWHSKKQSCMSFLLLRIVCLLLMLYFTWCCIDRPELGTRICNSWFGYSSWACMPQIKRFTITCFSDWETRHVHVQIAGPSSSHLNTTEAATCFCNPFFHPFSWIMEIEHGRSFALISGSKMRKRKFSANRWTFWRKSAADLASAASTTVVGSLPPLAPLVWDATLAPCGAAVPLAVPLASLFSAPFITGAAGATGAGGSCLWRMPLSFSTWMYGPTWAVKVTIWYLG